jgi:hypothetical protein
VSGVDVWLEGYHRGKKMLRGGRLYAAISIENAGNKEFDRLIVSPEVNEISKNFPYNKKIFPIPPRL